MSDVDIAFDLTDEDRIIGDGAIHLMNAVYHTPMFEGSCNSCLLETFLAAAINHRMLMQDNQMPLPLNDVERAEMHTRLDKWVDLIAKVQQRKNLQVQGVANVRPI